MIAVTLRFNYPWGDEENLDETEIDENEEDDFVQNM